LRVEYTPEFKRDLRALWKRHRHTRSDVEPVINQLSAGEIVGDRVRGTSCAIYKVRVRNSDIQKGKRSGYRVIYHRKTATNVIFGHDLFEDRPRRHIARADPADIGSGLAGLTEPGIAGLYPKASHRRTMPSKRPLRGALTRRPFVRPTPWRRSARSETGNSI